jgi:putative Flp pilus-assembly TadE/G-like protein
MGKSRGPSSRVRERGATAVIVAFVVGILCSFLLLALNIGHGYSVRAELQSAGDSAALAGAAEIGGNDLDALRTSLTTARTTANDYSKYHQTDSNVSVEKPEVRLGIWHSEAAPPWFELVSSSSADDATAPPAMVYEVNAVQVVAARDASQSGGALTVFGGGILKTSSMDVVTRATAARFGPCHDDCAAPIVFAACQLPPCGDSTTTPYNATDDNVGFTIYDPTKQGNGPNIQSLIMYKNKGVWTCNPPTTCSGIAAGTQSDIKVQNGADLGSTGGGASGDGQKIYDSLLCLKDLEIDVGIVDVPCPGGNPNFRGTVPLVGFAKITITAVDTVAKTITVYRDCGTVKNGPGHCRAFGMLSSDPVLTQ